ncbi:uncharacterized protein NPIL_651651 [Nephila pilipes]|uniref:Uncharacterized protein n=1 Tax=Nephila pilipes TaxID=299642 RepID=A0A8X6T4A5_NEPPI|nr:uncharacterized protein NPIL_651651 [Nephila pilipes]
MEILNRSRSTLKGKISRIEAFIKSANEETDSVETKVKLKNVIALQRNIEELRNNYYSIPNVKDAELASIDEELDLLEERLEKLERVWGYEMIQLFMKGIKLWKFLKKLLNSKMAVISYNFPLENLIMNCPIIIPCLNNVSRVCGEDLVMIRNYISNTVKSFSITQNRVL